MQKTETSSSGTSTESLINNGMLSILMNGKENQERVSSTKDLDSMLRDHSTLSLNYHLTDT